jgi:cytidylate kinase
MVRIITVEREYGSLGAEFARQLALHLGWELVDQALVDEIARRAHISASLAALYDERLDPWYQRVGKAFWHGSIECSPSAMDAKVLDAERVAGLLRDILEEKARAGNCVIVGRGASSVLQGVPGCFHIFVYAAMKRKVRWFENTFPEKAAQAGPSILAMDRRRAEYIQRFHHHAWNDYRMYHLMLNSCMGFDAMVGAALQATGLAQSVPAAVASPAQEGTHPPSPSSPSSSPPPSSPPSGDRDPSCP